MKNVESRLINANELKDRFKRRIEWLEKDKHDEYTTGIWDGCLYDAKLIDEMPTVDAVQVVRCKDCKHYENVCGCYYCFHPKMETGWNSEGGESLVMDAMDFCSYGERRSEW